MAETVSSIQTHLDELREYVSFYIAAKTQALKLTVRKGVIFLGLVIVAAVAAAGLIVTSVVLICVGIADALGLLFHSQWAGDLVAGALVIGAIVAGIWVVVNRIFKTSHAKTVERFDALRARQRVKFGHDVRQDANEAFRETQQRSPKN